MDGWNDFFVAMAGAAVAFAGLVLVSISINLDRIVQQPGLTGRASIPLIVLFTLFVSASTMLIPDQRISTYGIIVLLLAIAFSIVVTIVLRKQRGISRQLEQQGLVPRSSFQMRLGLCTGTALFMLAAGVILTNGTARGVFFMVPAMIIGFFLSFLEAWVLLIEIDR